MITERIFVYRLGFLAFIISLGWLVEKPLYAQSKIVQNIKNGKEQLVVVYGTSLSSGDCGKSWMGEVANYFNGKYGNHLKYSLSGKSGMWSTWGVEHLEDSVIAKKPDAVLIEFAINDAHEKFKTSPKLASLNLEYMIERIKLQYPSCEIILQVMNMPVGGPARYRPNLNEYYNVYRKVAKAKKLLLIDHYPNWQKILKQGNTIFLEYVPDGIHPNKESGKNVIAPWIINCLENNNRSKQTKIH
ncbi:MAG: SGNH/GDSL hydrolase family protein [Salinivirgaceae bacterium]|nr:SGNH/GDSL hydrolase family protein [Salinivirgaceae bacterium]